MKSFKVERRGRKRRVGARYPSGDLVKERDVLEARIIAFRQPHRREAPEKRRDDPKACWPFGILNLRGIVSDTQYQAGLYYGADVRRYRSRFLPECPHDSPASIAGYMQPISGGGPNSMTNEDVAKRYDGAVRAVIDAGQKAAKAVARVAVFGEKCLPGMERYLLMGLDKLAAHYRLTHSNK